MVYWKIEEEEEEHKKRHVSKFINFYFELVINES